jgi:O-antigen/teichoic acid export membrane protein
MSFLDRNLAKEISWIGIGSIVAQALGLIFMLILARTYSVSDYGLINYTISVGMIVSTFVTAGFPSALVRFISKYINNQEKIDMYFTNVLIATLVILFFVSTVVSVIFRDAGIISIVVGYSLISIYLGIIRGFIIYWKIAIFNVLWNLIKVVVLAIVSYIFFIKSPLFVILLYAFGGLGAIIILELLDLTHIHFHKNYISKRVIKEISSFSIPVTVSMVAYSTLSSIPIILIKSSEGYYWAGLYSAALALTAIFSIIPTAITTITMPKISSIDNKRLRIQYTKQSIKLVLIAGIILFIFIFFFGKLVLQIAFSEKYVASYQFLLVLSAGATFAGLRNVYSALWEGSGRPIISTYDIATASIICISLSLFLIPYLGPIGAAYGYSLGLFTAVLVDLFFWMRYRYSNILN